ncbi:MAG: hypothetical protein WD875_17135 [Pirellulales bacterium]
MIATSTFAFGCHRSKTEWTRAASLVAALALALATNAIASAEPGVADKPWADVPAESRTIASGIGGMAWLDARRLLVVHDTKVGSDGPRIGVLRISSSGEPRYRAAIVDWSKAGGESNDLEALAAIPDKPGEFFAVESGYYQQQYGRLIRLRAKFEENGVCRVATVSAWQLPDDTDNVEGLVCVSRGAGKLLIVLGERGGEVSEASTSGRLRWTELDLDRPGRLSIGENAQALLPIPTAGWARPKSVRGCGDLYLDAKGRLWSAAAEDPGDAGPFRSVIFHAATVDAKAGSAVRVEVKPAAKWTLDGAKVEAITDPLAGVGELCIATDDENYGALWRPLALPQE